MDEWILNLCNFHPLKIQFYYMIFLLDEPKWYHVMDLKAMRKIFEEIKLLLSYIGYFWVGCDLIFKLSLFSYYNVTNWFKVGGLDMLLEPKLFINPFLWPFLIVVRWASLCGWLLSCYHSRVLIWIYCGPISMLRLPIYYQLVLSWMFWQIKVIRFCNFLVAHLGVVKIYL